MDENEEHKCGCCAEDCEDEVKEDKAEEDHECCGGCHEEPEDFTISHDERKLIRILLDKHLEEIRANEQLLNQQAAVFAAEAKYEDFVEKLKDKF